MSRISPEYTLTIYIYLPTSIRHVINFVGILSHVVHDHENIMANNNTSLLDTHFYSEKK